MKNIKIFIVDDERSARELIKNLLIDENWIEIAGEAESVESAIEQIIRHKPDVLLLDIQMPRQDGFALIELLQKHEIEIAVIFVTAFEEHAVRAIKASAFDYLLKPVNKSELISSLEKLSLKVSSLKAKEKFRRLIYQLRGHKKIMFKNRTGFYMIDPSEILFCQADSNYSVLVLGSGKNVTVSMSLGKIEEILPEFSFQRISRSAIVNINYLCKVDRKRMTCELGNEERHVLSISRKYLKSLEEGCDNLNSSGNNQTR